MAQPWWYQGCLNNITKLGGKMCPTNHCDQTIVKNYSEAYCSCTGPYPNGCAPTRKPHCCSYTAESPVPILSEGCYCCCGCLANNTPVAVDGAEYKAIEEFMVGDLVYVADDIELQKWSQRRVMFSSGTGDLGGNNTLIKVTYGEGDELDYLLVNRAQLFLLPHGKLKAAATLVPGVDAVVMKDQSPRVVQGLEVGTFKKGLHHIATTTTPAKQAGGHLLLAKDVVVGDWALQVALTSGNADSLSLVEQPFEQPEFGTKAYAEAHPNLDISDHHAKVKGAQLPASDPTEFEPFGIHSGTYVPENASAYLTLEQSEDILNHGSTEPATSEAGRELLVNLFNTYQGFYPDILFYYDNPTQLPNAFSFEEYGKKVVFVTGGLVRNNDMGYEGLALVIAHQIAAFFDTEPTNENGYLCVGMADFTAISSVLPHVWVGLRSRPIIEAGIDQIAKVFGAITPPNREGKKGNTCDLISIACRETAMKAALDMLPLPACAGGPPDAALSVSGASAVSSQSGATITVSFNLPVDESTATDLGNYAFDPLITTISAKMGDTPEEVVIEGDAEHGKSYEVTVIGVVSLEGQPLKRDEDKAEFSVQ